MTLYNALSQIVQYVTFSVSSFVIINARNQVCDPDLCYYKMEQGVLWVVFWNHGRNNLENVVIFRNGQASSSNLCQQRLFPHYSLYQALRRERMVTEYHPLSDSSFTSLHNYHAYISLAIITSACRTVKSRIFVMSKGSITGELLSSSFKGHHDSDNIYGIVCIGIRK